jgi:hypothetical protein
MIGPLRKIVSRGSVNAHGREVVILSCGHATFHDVTDHGKQFRQCAACQRLTNPPKPLKITPPFALRAEVIARISRDAASSNHGETEEAEEGTEVISS